MPQGRCVPNGHEVLTGPLVRGSVPRLQGVIDGYLGTGSRKAFERHLRAHGNEGAIDGIAGTATKAAFERFTQGLLCDPCSTPQVGHLRPTSHFWEFVGQISSDFFVTLKG